MARKVNIKRYAKFHGKSTSIKNGPYQLSATHLSRTTVIIAKLLPYGSLNGDYWGLMPNNQNKEAMDIANKARQTLILEAI